MFLLYGSTGYTGALIAREAVRRGLRPVLAGRSADTLARQAAELGLEHRVAPLADPSALDAALRGLPLVLHCAGPFFRTSAPMAKACLRSRVHYLDITGELGVFEALAARDAEARVAGIMLLPGVGFDVVPSDCLAAHLQRRLPTATRLRLAFQGGGRISRGTMTTMIEHAHEGGRVRRGGRLVRVPVAWKRRREDLGEGPVDLVTIPWGDVATAYHTTGIGDIRVYTAVPQRLRPMLLAMRWLRPLLALRPVKALQQCVVRAGPPGPTDEERARGRSLLWGEVSDDASRRAVSRMRGPDGYTMTVLTALACVQRVLAGQAPPGFQTPARAYGPDLILEIEGVTREDVE
ncbi:MAG: saccharopine dehydrogenase NADP-binding domain-containing protein [Gemmatimonadetes bacterium]|nr:saccharopine dehydrogenase NADP-binding domain-containing protein [Gemmatimonadota bacterium]